MPKMLVFKTLILAINYNFKSNKQTLLNFLFQDLQNTAWHILLELKPITNLQANRHEKKKTQSKKAVQSQEP